MLHAALVLCSLATGCVDSGATPGDTPGDPTAVRPLTCAMIDGPNCWSESLSTVAACAPGRTSVGKLAAGGTSCTYPTGAVVMFSRDVTTLGDREDFGFELSTNGAPCVAFSTARGTPNVQTLRTSLGETSWSVGTTVRLGCADGTVYETELASALACDRFPAVLGFTTVTGADVFEFSLLRTPRNVDVFSCDGR